MNNRPLDKPPPYQAYRTSSPISRPYPITATISKSDLILLLFHFIIYTRGRYRGLASQLKTPGALRAPGRTLDVRPRDARLAHA